MGLHVVEAACRFANDRSSATIVLESDIVHDFPQAIEELNSVHSRTEAQGYAAQCGVPDPRINGNPGGTYPINEEGVPLDQVRDEFNQPLPPQHPRMQVARYRIDIPICRRLV